MALFGRKANSSSDSASTPAPTGTVDAAPDAAPAGKAKKARAPKAPKAAAKPRGLKNGTAVGLNIGNSFIKAVEVTAKNGELAITGMGVVPTPPESYANGNVLSVSALSNAIKTLWKQAGFKSKTAVFSVSGTGSLVVRVIEVPKMTDDELADNMRVDADRYIPFPPSEVIMDFKALRDLPSDPDAPNMEVLLAAAQREVIDLHVKVVQNARLSPGAIDVEPIAAARAVALENRGNSAFVDYDDVSALLNIGATGTEISVLRGDLIVFTRTVPIGGNNLTTALAEGLGLPIHEAEKFKIERGDALPPAGYDPNAGQDFDFDQFGGTPGAEAGDLSYNAFDTGSAPATAQSGSSDPFDLDYFNQNNEPGTGHSQKEGDTPSDPGPFSFSFDKDEDAVPSQANPAPAAESAPASSDAGDFSFDFPGETTDSQATNSSPQSSPTEPAGMGGFSFDDVPDQVLPESSASPTSAAAAAPAPQATPADQTPPSMPMPIPSAFDFSDFDLPATTENTTSTSVTPVASTPATPVAPVTVTPSTPAPAPDAFSFGFQSEPAPATEAAPVSEGLSLSKPEETESAPALNLSKDDEDAFATSAFESSSDTTPTEVAPPGDVLVAEATEAGTSDFDLDALFGSQPAQTASGNDPAGSTSAGTTVGDDSFDIGGLDLGAAAGGAALGAAGAGLAAGSAANDEGGFDLGAVGGTDDLDDFGVGLGSSSMTDADAVALYNAIHPVLEELAGEVRRSLEFHLGRYPDTNFTRLLLIGGGARLKNLDSYLTQMIGVPTSVAVPSGYVAAKAPKLSPEYIATNSPICAVALGLAIRDFIE